MSEIWKDIPGYEGMYQISNLCNIRSLKFNKIKLLKANFDRNGYYKVNLHINGGYKTFKRACLILMAFKGYKPNGKLDVVIDHINNIKSDDSLENLQIISQRLNVSKDIKGRSSVYTGVYFDKSRNRYKAHIYVNGKQITLGRFKTELEAHEAYQNKLLTLKN